MIWNWCFCLRRFFSWRCRMLAFFCGNLRYILGILLKTRLPCFRCRRRTLVIFQYGCWCENICGVRAGFMVNCPENQTPLTLQSQIQALLKLRNIVVKGSNLYQSSIKAFVFAKTERRGIFQKSTVSCMMGGWGGVKNLGLQGPYGTWNLVFYTPMGAGEVMHAI